MRQEESYQGRRIVLTVQQTVDGTWAWEAEVPDEGYGSAISGLPDETFGTADEALRAARSAAAATVDRARTSRGKP